MSDAVMTTSNQGRHACTFSNTKNRLQWRLGIASCARCSVRESAATRQHRDAELRCMRFGTHSCVETYASPNHSRASPWDRNSRVPSKKQQLHGDAHAGQLRKRPCSARTSTYAGDGAGETACPVDMEEPKSHVNYMSDKVITLLNVEAAASIAAGEGGCCSLHRVGEVQRAASKVLFAATRPESTIQRCTRTLCFASNMDRLKRRAHRYTVCLSQNVGRE